MSTPNDLTKSHADTLRAMLEELPFYDREEVALNAAVASLERPSGFYITEDQFIHLLQDVWAMGYAVIDGMPVDENVVRICHKSLSDNFCSIEFPGDLFEMMQRVSARDDAKAEGR